MGKRAESEVDLDERVQELEKKMLEAADELDFELAAELRDRIEQMRNPEAHDEDAPKTKAGTPGSRAGRTGRKRRK